MFLSPPLEDPMANPWPRVTELEPKLQASRDTLINLTPLSLTRCPVASTVHAQCMFTESLGLPRLYQSLLGHSVVLTLSEPLP